MNFAPGAMELASAEVVLKVRIRVVWDPCVPVPSEYACTHKGADNHKPKS